MQRWQTGEGLFDDESTKKPSKDEQFSFRQHAVEMMEHVQGRIDEINDLLCMIHDQQRNLEEELSSLQHIYEGLTYYIPQDLSHG